MLLLKSVISLCEEVKKYHQKKSFEQPGFLQVFTCSWKAQQLSQGTNLF